LSLLWPYLVLRLLLLQGGHTTPLRFKIPLTIDESSTCLIKKNTHLSSLLQINYLIVWDESLINNKCCFEALDHSICDVLSGRDNCYEGLPFGGKTILFGGDFQQKKIMAARNYFFMVMSFMDSSFYSCQLNYKK